MAEQNKPDLRYVWASGGAIVAPSSTKIATGWTPEVPPYQWENYLQNRQDTMLVHINQHGIPQWDALTEYFAGKSHCLGSDGQVYKAVASSSPATTTQDPTTDTSDTYWRIAFADAGLNYLTQTTADTRYLQRANNLSDVTNTATARTNLGAAALASPAFTGTPTAPTAALNTNSTQLATTAFLFNQFTATGQQNLSANGYQRLPGGLIIQWGTGITGAGGNAAAISFALTFPNNFFAVTTQCPNISGTADVIETQAFTNSGFTAVGVSSGSGGLTNVSFRYIAVGN